MLWVLFYCIELCCKSGFSPFPLSFHPKSANYNSVTVGVLSLCVLCQQVDFDSENGPVVYDTLKKIFKHTLEENRKMTKDGLQSGV